MEEMTEIVTTFYSLEGASKGVALERWDFNVLSNTNKKNFFLNISYLWPQPYLEYFVKIFVSGLKQSSNSSTPMVMGASTKKNFASKIAKQITFFHFYLFFQENNMIGIFYLYYF